MSSQIAGWTITNEVGNKNAIIPNCATMLSHFRVSAFAMCSLEINARLNERANLQDMSCNVPVHCNTNDCYMTSHVFAHTRLIRTNTMDAEWVAALRAADHGETDHGEGKAGQQCPGRR